MIYIKTNKYNYTKYPRSPSVEIGLPIYRGEGLRHRSSASRVSLGVGSAMPLQLATATSILASPSFESSILIGELSESFPLVAAVHEHISLLLLL